MTRRRRRFSTLMSQKVTSPPTQAQTIRGRMERRRGASRRSSTMTAMLPLPHQGATTMRTPHRKRKRLIKTIPLILSYPLQFKCTLLSIPLGKPPHFDGDDYSFGVIKCAVIYFLSILVFGK
jgi:hypothetical protein